MTDLELDENNRRLITSSLDKNYIVSASAGSGKTSMLVERLVALVESGAKVSEIVALTFTKKAAAEFYERFYKKLELRSKPGFNADEVESEKHTYLTKTVTEEVRKLDEAALKDIDTCFLGTIDSFIQRILNEHPLEANISSSATIVDDDMLTSLCDEVAIEALKDSDNKLFPGTVAFAYYFDASSYPTVLKSFVSRHGYRVNYPKANIEDLYDEYERVYDIVFNGIVTIASNPFESNIKTGDCELTYDHISKKLHFFKHLDKRDFYEVRRFFNKVKSLRVTESTCLKQEFLDLGEKKYHRTKKVDYYEFANLKDIIIDLINEIIYCQLFEYFESASERVTELMNEKGILTFHEAMQFALKMLRKDDKTNVDVISKLQAKYKYFLIDEFQDTDLFQCELFFRLTSTDRRLEWTDLKPLPGSLFMVGDRKQSIYHFRGADVNSYDKIVNLFTSKNVGEIICLTRNFRSTDNVKQYFNDVFKTALTSDKHPDIPNIDPSKVDKDNSSVTYYKTASKADPAEVANLIAKLYNGSGDPNFFKKVMVLTSGKDKIASYASELLKKGIPFFTEGLIDLEIADLCKTILQLFRCMVKPQDGVNVLNLLSGPLFKFDFTTTIDLSTDYLAPYHIKYDPNALPSVNLKGLLLNKKLIKVLGFDGFDILVRFYNLVKEMEISGEISSNIDALNYLEKCIEDKKSLERLTMLSNSTNAVKITNIHKVKGLEAKIVILTQSKKPNETFDAPTHIHNDGSLTVFSIKDSDSFTAKPIMLNPDYCYDKENLSPECQKERDYAKGEEERLLYVAATRSRESLFIAKTFGKDDSLDGKWDPLILGDLKESEIEESNIPTDTFDIDSVSITNKVDISSSSIPSYEVVNASKITLKERDEEQEETVFTTSFNKDEFDALVFGTLVHKLMEIIAKSKDKILSDDVCKQIARDVSYSEYCFALNQIKKTIYNGGFKQISGIDDDIYSLMKKGNVYPEFTYSYKENNELHTGIIDLIIELDDEIIIVDYKTDSKAVDHTPQLNEYKKVLKKTFSKKVSTYIYNIY